MFQTENMTEFRFSISDLNCLTETKLLWHSDPETGTELWKPTEIFFRSNPRIQKPANFLRAHILQGPMNRKRAAIGMPPQTFTGKWRQCP
ncbi:MAG: hypothetical protein CVV64_02935 [Candidatus Wallbacteria bacterium HGW-Wallbacteria-1]|uniref:Uncharacterized protein n=1 Tax=Candidatus Wallbacteria bacterium HGW-Wallbacteria-1 TaxID=2013854 RepID=A0A2N1PTG6_9BACT|nr:MAG: hypothetical protein CVV64_02935 [Candidatus Wallbacteria bacterium HGW-Wallbacteria-1]